MYLCDYLIVIDIIQVKKLAASYVILGQVDVLKELSITCVVYHREFAI